MLVLTPPNYPSLKPLYDNSERSSKNQCAREKERAKSDSSRIFFVYDPLCSLMFYSVVQCQKWLNSTRN